METQDQNENRTETETETEWGPDIQSVTLEKLKFALEKHIPRDEAEYAASWDWLGEELVVALRGFVWAEVLESEIYRWPADWREAFKERWFPAWAKKRWPVRYEEVQLDVKAIYPDLRPSVPGQSYTIQVLRGWDRVRPMSDNSET